jgi:hypothetical protein
MTNVNKECIALTKPPRAGQNVSKVGRHINRIGEKNEAIFVKKYAIQQSFERTAFTVLMRRLFWSQYPE